MPIILTEYESRDGMTEHVTCQVEDFADESEVGMVLDAFDSICRRDRGSENLFRREEDSSWAVPDGIIRKNGAKKLLAKVEKELTALGYAQHIKREFVSKERGR